LLPLLLLLLLLLMLLLLLLLLLLQLLLLCLLLLLLLLLQRASPGGRQVTGQAGNLALHFVCVLAVRRHLSLSARHVIAQTLRVRLDVAVQVEFESKGLRNRYISLYRLKG
jgi:hypothetical protein